MKSGRGRRSYSSLQSPVGTWPSPSGLGGLAGWLDGWLTDWQNQLTSIHTGRTGSGRFRWASGANPGTGEGRGQEGGGWRWSLDACAQVEVGFFCDAPLPRAWTAFWDF